MGVTQAAGLSLRWFRDTLGHDYMKEAEQAGLDPYVVMDHHVEHVPIGSRRLLYLPYLMGERTPHLDPDCRGVFFGLSAIHTQDDMLRAVMEGVSYSLTDCQDILRDMGIVVQEMMACGGGGRSPLWRQMLADMYNCEVKTVSSKEGPALGAAILAGVGAGLFKNVVTACRDFIDTKTYCQPDPTAHAYYEKGHALYQKLYRQLAGCYQDLATL